MSEMMHDTVSLSHCHGFRSMEPGRYDYFRGMELKGGLIFQGISTRPNLSTLLLLRTRVSREYIENSTPSVSGILSLRITSESSLDLLSIPGSGRVEKRIGLV